MYYKTSSSVLIAVLLLLPVLIFGQDDPILIFEGKVSDVSGIKIEGAKISVKQDGSVIKTETTASNGKYKEIKCDFGHIYELTFSKSGYVSKTLLLDTKKGYYPEEVEKKSYIESSVQLFKKQSDVDYSIVTDRPVGKARINPTDSKLDWDFNYVNQRKKEIESYIKSVAENARQQEELFNKMVKEGNLAFTKTNYSIAILKYKEALKIKSSSAVVQKIKDAEDKIAQLEKDKEKDAEFLALIQKGENLILSQKFDEAIAIFNQAKEVKPGDRLPYTKIEEAENKKQELANAEINKKYQAKMAEAKKAFDQKTWDSAKKLYQEASDIKPSERDPKDRIIQIDGIVANEKSAEENYANLIKEGEESLTSKDYDKAILKYNAALQIKPLEQLPKQQIKKAQELKAEAERLAQLDNQYNSIISKADKFFNDALYNEAKNEYQQALKIKSNEQYPNDQLIAIAAKLKEIEDNRIQQEENKRKFDELIVKADDAFYKEEWENSKDIYSQSLLILPNEKYPQQKIEQINAKIAQIERDKLARKTQYDKLISSADEYFYNKNWKESSRIYNSALDIYPDETYPKEQLSKIEQEIIKEQEQKKIEDAKIADFNKFIFNGDGEFSILNYEKSIDYYNQAKAIFPENESVLRKIDRAKQKLKESQDLAEKQSKYDSFISSADQLRDAKEWSKSKEDYQNALSIFSEKTYPKKQIELINSKIEEFNRLEKQNTYQQFIDAGDQLFSEKNYTVSLQKFEEAKKIFPTEAYPLEKIREIRRLISQNEDFENQYKTAIAQGDNFFSAKKWQESFDAYTQAISFFDREYPKEQIALIEQELKKIKDQQAQFAQKKKQYDELITKGDNEYSTKKYSEAKLTFEAALQLFQDEYYPKQQLSKIDKKLAEIEAENALKSQYDQVISSADAARDAKNWSSAKDLYRKANAIDSKPTYPQDQINWINEQMKKETENEFKAQYQKLLDAADNQFTSKSYAKSKELYERAKRMNPEDGYPAQRINEIEKLIREMAENKLLEQNQKAQQEKYDNLIRLADGSRDSQQWVKAKSYYKQAFDVKNTESYPQEQIDWINNKMGELANEEVETQYAKIIEVADNQFAQENYAKAIELYKRARGIKPTDPYPPAQILKAEDARSSALNKQKKTDLFNTHVKLGNAALENKKYKLALRKFQDALSIRPEAPYPAEKIRAINDILDAIAARKLSKTANKDLPTDFVDNYQVLYGEEVTGQYSESQIDQLIHKNRVDDNDYLQKRMVNEKDELISANEQKLDRQRAETDNRYKQLDIIDDERLNSQIDDDNIRLDNIPQIDHFKEMESQALDQRISYGKQSAYDNAVSNEQMISEKALNSQDADLIRQQNNIPNTEFYKDNMYSVDEIRAQSGKDQTYDNNTTMNLMTEDRTSMEVEKDKIRQNTVPQIDIYKDELSMSNEVITDQFKVVTYSNYDSKEALDQRISTLSSEADENRQETIPKLENYKDVVSNDLSIIEQNSQNTTYSNFESKENLDTRISEFAQNADVQRQEVIPELDRYLDKESNVQSVWSEIGADKSYNQYTSKETIDNQRYAERMEKDISREMKSSELEALQDMNSDNSKNAYEQDILNDYQSNSELDLYKAFDPKAESEKYKQQLALEYPEGITEKMYQRKNTRGDVIEVTIIRIVVRGSQGDEYKKVTSKWGSYYFKNNLVISEYIWDSETN